MHISHDGDLDLDEFLARPLFAHLATCEKGVPRESPVWFLWENQAIWILGNRDSDTFPRRIEAEPRCAIGIVDFDVGAGKVHHVGFRGTAHVTHFDRERAVRKLTKYLGADRSQWDTLRFSLSKSSLVFIRFQPETVVIRDQSYPRI